MPLHDAVAKTLPIGSVMYETEHTANGQQIHIWVEPAVADKLGPDAFVHRRSLAVGTICCLGSLSPRRSGTRGETWVGSLPRLTEW